MTAEKKQGLVIGVSDIVNKLMLMAVVFFSSQVYAKYNQIDKNEEKAAENEKSAKQNKQDIIELKKVTVKLLESDELTTKKLDSLILVLDAKMKSSSTLESTMKKLLNELEKEVKKKKKTSQ